MFVFIVRVSMSPIKPRGGPVHVHAVSLSGRPKALRTSLSFLIAFL